MPAGLDGNPRPLVTPARTEVLRTIAGLIVQRGGARVLVGVDGRSGAGKSTFADELARALGADGTAVVRSTTDLFHRPRAERMRRGPTSAVGYVDDSHQLERIVDDLLLPFRDGAHEVLIGAFDEPTDQPRELVAQLPERAILVFDGLFIHRRELVALWDISLLLVADARLDAGWLTYLTGALPEETTERAAELDRRLERARWPRYRAGWQHYLETHQPHRSATLVIDNDDLATPALIA